MIGDIWNELHENGFAGLEAFVGNDVALDIISYGGNEYCWMVRQWNAYNSCDIVASYDSDVYFDTCDEALAACLIYLEYSRSDIWELIQVHPIRDAMFQFARKAACLGFALTLAFSAVFGAISLTTEEAYAMGVHISTTSSMMTAARVANSGSTHADRMSHEDEVDQILAEYGVITYTEAEAMVLGEGSDIATLFSDMAQSQDGYATLQECIIYKITTSDGTPAVAFVSSEKAHDDYQKIRYSHTCESQKQFLVTDPEIVSLCYGEIDAQGVEALYCDALDIPSDALQDYVLASNFDMRYSSEIAALQAKADRGSTIVAVVLGGTVLVVAALVKFC